MDQNKDLLVFFKQSTQCRNWFFTTEELKRIREQSLQDGIKRVTEAIRKEQELTGIKKQTEPEFLALEEQLTYCRVYEKKLLDFCKYFRLPKAVQATALAFIRRLYLRNTVMDLDPKIYILACASLSCKVENIRVSFDEFVSKMPKAPSHKILFDSELHLSTQLKSTGMKSPKLIGENSNQPKTYTKELNSKTLNEDIQFLLKLYNRAQDFVIPGILSDIFFTHPPSRIALACMFVASEEFNWENTFLRYIENRFSKTKVPLLVIVEDLKTVKSEIKAVVEEEYNKDLVAKIDSKLKTCLNPEFNESSALYKEINWYNSTLVSSNGAAKIEL